MQNVYIKALVNYALKEGLIEKEDEIFAIHQLLDVLDLQEFNQPEFVPEMALNAATERLLNWKSEE